MNNALRLTTLLLALSLPALAQLYPKTDSVSFGHSLLNAGTPDTLFLRDSAATASDCGFTVRKAGLFANLHLGGTYKYGDADFSVSSSNTCLHKFFCSSAMGAFEGGDSTSLRKSAPSAGEKTPVFVCFFSSVVRPLFAGVGYFVHL